MSLITSLLLLASTVCASESPQKEGHKQSGQASYYANRFNGCRTTSGERVKLHLLTGAHRTFPFNTLVEVTNQSNQQSVIIRINDRGPFHKGRVVDLTTAAARAIGMLGRGVANVTLRVVGKGRYVTQLDESPTLDGRSPLLPGLVPVQ